MQITENTTDMEADLTVWTDKSGREFCVVVVKGTFTVLGGGETRLANEQHPLVFADEHHGDPATTSIKYECDFAPFKPRADILVNGMAVSPTGNPLTEMTVGIKVGNVRKVARVRGDRRWSKGLSGQSATDPVPFVEMPLIWERAFGGMDNSHSDTKRHGAEVRNLVGVGFRRNPDVDAVEGLPLPNLEHPNQQMRNWNDRVAPIGFGPLGRGWQPRLSYAGTYDEKWQEERFPFLPEDFDERYFQCAPEDQQTSHFQGGEEVVCANMSVDRQFKFSIPHIRFPIRAHFRDRDELLRPAVDTLIVEPDRGRFMLVWRSRVAIGKKIDALREITLGEPPRVSYRRGRSGKRQFRTISDFIAWKRKQERLR